MKLRLIASLVLTCLALGVIQFFVGSIRISVLLDNVELLTVLSQALAATSSTLDTVTLPLLLWLLSLGILAIVPVSWWLVKSQPHSVENNADRVFVDIPISSPDDDVLRREEYVAALTHRVLTSAQDGVVIAVNGAWGAGKSSVLNLVAYRLCERDDVVTAWFRPWHYESLSALIDALLEAVAQSTEPDDGWLDWLSSAFPHSPRARFRRHIRSARAALQGVRVEAATLGIGGVSVSFGRRRPEPVNRSFDLARRALADANLRVVLFAEDLDRLSSEQARRFFSLLFSLRQLGRLAIVLPMDSVELRRILGDDRHLIERLVDVDEPLPAIEQVQIEAFFFAELDSIFKRHRVVVTDKQDQELRTKSRFVVGRWMQDLRRAKHLLNAVNGTLGLAGTELHPVDLVLVETLRLAFPEVHRDLPGMWDVLTDAPRQTWLFGTETERNARRKRLVEWLDRVQSSHPEERESIESFIESLFPGTPSFARGNSEPSVEYEQEASGRIASHMNFSRYFLYRAEIDDVPNPDADRVVSAASVSADAATQEMNRFLDAHGAKGRRMIERLMQRAQGIPPEQAAALADAVIAVTPNLSQERGPLDVSQWERSQTLLWNMANRVSNPAVVIAKWANDAPQLDYSIRLLTFLDPERNHVFERWDEIDRGLLIDELERRVDNDPESLVSARYRLPFLRLLGPARSAIRIVKLMDAGVLTADDITAWFLQESYGFGGEPVGRRIDHSELLETLGVDGLQALAGRGTTESRFAGDLAQALRLGGEANSAIISE